MDITDTQDLGASRMTTLSTPIFPAKATFQDKVNPLLDELSKTNMHKNLKKFTSLYVDGNSLSIAQGLDYGPSGSWTIPWHTASFKILTLSLTAIPATSGPTTEKSHPNGCWER